MSLPYRTACYTDLERCFTSAFNFSRQLFLYISKIHATVCRTSLSIILIAFLLISSLRSVSRTWLWREASWRVGDSCQVIACFCRARTRSANSAMYPTITYSMYIRTPAQNARLPRREALIWRHRPERLAQFPGFNVITVLILLGRDETVPQDICTCQTFLFIFPCSIFFAGIVALADEYSSGHRSRRRRRFRSQQRYLENIRIIPSRLSCLSRGLPHRGKAFYRPVTRQALPSSGLFARLGYSVRSTPENYVTWDYVYVYSQLLTKCTETFYLLGDERLTFPPANV